MATAEKSSQRKRNSVLELARAQERHTLFERYLEIYRRLQIATLIEIGICGLVAVMTALVHFDPAGGDTFGETFVRTTREPAVAISWLTFFVEVFTQVLTGRSIIVGLYAAIAKPDRDFHRPDNDETIVEKFNKPVSAADVLLLFDGSVRRSTETLKTAQRRPNALLLIGAGLAIAGLGFFIATLPGFIGGSDSPGGSPQTADIFQRTLDLMPRLLMLLFIQLLAGFFLRQYRTSMEELRYYEAILRRREGQFLTFQLMRLQGVTDHAALFESLTDQKEKDVIRLQQGETTMILETQRGEANEFKGLPEMVFDFLKSEQK